MHSISARIQLQVLTLRVLSGYQEHKRRKFPVSLGECCSYLITPLFRLEKNHSRFYQTFGVRDIIPIPVTFNADIYMDFSPAPEYVFSFLQTLCGYES